MSIKKGTHLYVVATVVEGLDESDSFGDILLITTSRGQAYTLKTNINNRKPLKTIKYEYLQEFKEAVIMTFSLGDVITNNNE